MYKIGELASAANVSKRTIDYYTKLGLLQAKRSPSNYRYYSEEALEDLKFIENCKKLHMPLDEIRKKMDLVKNQHVEEEEVLDQAKVIARHLEHLNQELSGFMPIVEKLDDDQKRLLSTQLSNQSMSLIQSLLVLLI